MICPKANVKAPIVIELEEFQERYGGCGSQECYPLVYQYLSSTWMYHDYSKVLKFKGNTISNDNEANTKLCEIKSDIYQCLHLTVIINMNI